MRKEESKVSKKKIKDVIFLGNGNTAVFDEDGEQIPELQKTWVLLFLNVLRDAGYSDADIASIRVRFPHGVGEFIPKHSNWTLRC